MSFRTLQVDDYEMLKPFFLDQPYNLSIYTLPSIIAWSNQVFSTSYTIYKGICFLANEHLDNTQKRHLFLPVLRERLFTPFELWGYALELCYKQYTFVPGDYLNTFQQSEWEKFFFIREQKEYEDYVYRTDDLIQLKGNRYSNKRNYINQFKRSYLFYNRVSVASIQKDDVAECKEFLDIWCEERDCSSEDKLSLACEKSALNLTLEHLDRFESMGLLIRIDGKVSALGIGSELNKATVTLNFEKAFSDIKGLYQFLDNECAKKLFSEYQLINKESDMDLPQLANSKQSYYPFRRVKSFELIIR